jgi:hypothetical protein
MPPSPEQMPVPASSAPVASASLASSERAPKLMSETKRGMSSRSGVSASGPITSSVPTDASSSSGLVAIWATITCRSSQCGRSLRGTPIDVIGP